MSPREEQLVEMLQKLADISALLANNEGATPKVQHMGFLITTLCSAAIETIEDLSDQLAAHTAMSARVSIN